ncbi:MAG: GH116 family glycosyl hydrolase [Candidatus Firestonebacteria bacterium]
MIYTGKNIKEIAFPLGGIGTGSISLGGWGQLRDWEIMNKPNKSNERNHSDFQTNNGVPKHTFFTVKINQKNKNDIIKVLQGNCEGDFIGYGNSGQMHLGEGLPHFRKVKFVGNYPFAKVILQDVDIPVDVTLEAFNPFIPLNAKDSGIPAAILLYHFKNTSNKTIEGTIYGNLRNIIGDPEKEGKINKIKKSSNLTGLYLTTDKFKNDSPKYGSIALSTISKNVKILPKWKDDRLSKFWQMLELDKLPEDKGLTEIGTVAIDFKIKANEIITIPFFLTWYFPNFEKYWGASSDCCGTSSTHEIWKNYYATVWKDAWDVAKYTVDNFDRLYNETKLFADTLFSSTLPDYVLDAISSQVSILKTTTCIRLEDGTFYGFEGCHNTGGCCEGSCAHVWNYVQAVAYLFPELQRSMREADYKYSMAKDGFIQFRLPLPLGKKPDFNFPPAADGQMGGIMQVYREWLISGDDKWLKEIWPSAKKSLEFAWKYWDKDKDGVMEGMQHNTYDCEVYGPNTMMGSLYLGALRAGEEIARYLGEIDKADEYRKLFEKGSKWTDKNLFNGEYYEQKVNPEAHKIWPKKYIRLAEEHGKDDKFPSWPKWQYGKGCLSDQLIGQWYAEMLGLGYFYSRENTRKTLKSIFKYNWKKDLSGHANFLRTYALNDESGLVICSWPKGGRPGYALVDYPEEIWTGIEYQVASHLIYEGFIKEGLDICKGVRNRYNGEKRNPWDEIECGHHYARAMSSYALLLAFSGFSYSAPEKKIGFSPRVNQENFATFFSIGSGWGYYQQKIKNSKTILKLEIKYGELKLQEVAINIKAKKCFAKFGNKQIAVKIKYEKEKAHIIFNNILIINKEKSLKLYLS